MEFIDLKTTNTKFRILPHLDHLKQSYDRRVTKQELDELLKPQPCIFAEFKARLMADPELRKYADRIRFKHI